VRSAGARSEGQVSVGMLFATAWRNQAREAARSFALILRAPRHANWTRDPLGPHALPPGGSAWGRTQGRITFPPLAQRQALPKLSSKRPRFPWCSFQAPRSRRLQYSRGVIPGVLQARLYIEPPYRARNAASDALRERRCPQGERGRNTRGDNPQICETPDRRPAGDPVVSYPSW
jgi:hypothetical protein